MPYVKRNADGRISSIHAGADDPDCVEVAADDPELTAFLSAQGSEPAYETTFHQLDLDFIRVIEDVIYLLIDKRLIVLTDLPVAAQRKLAERRNIRGRSGDLSDIVNTDEDLPIP